MLDDYIRVETGAPPEVTLCADHKKYIYSCILLKIDFFFFFTLVSKMAAVYRLRFDPDIYIIPLRHAFEYNFIWKLSLGCENHQLHKRWENWLFIPNRLQRQGTHSLSLQSCVTHLYTLSPFAAASPSSAVFSLISSPKKIKKVGFVAPSSGGHGHVQNTKETAAAATQKIRIGLEVKRVREEDHTLIGFKYTQPKKKQLKVKEK